MDMFHMVLYTLWYHIALKMEQVRIKAIRVQCHKCGHRWLYRGKKPNYRVRCPSCHSSKNNLNYEVFGKWRPDGGSL